MRLATIRRGTSTIAAVVESENTARPIEGCTDVGELLAKPNWRALADATSTPAVQFQEQDLAPVIPNPGKIVCVGMNYVKHIKEMGRDLPDFPTLFIKFPEALTGPFDDIHIPDYANSACDWEGEMAVIIGKQARRVKAADAENYIAGYAVMNDYSMRDKQFCTLQWHQGKSFEKTAGFGPWMTTRDPFEFGGELRTNVNGELMQQTPNDDLLFSPADLIEYISHIYPLNPGDVIVTGTPAGVGHAREPKRYIADGDIVEITIDGLGTIRNKTIFD